MGNAKRNVVLDKIKAIACISVILIHCRFPGVFGDICEALARFGVPMFFAVSGKYLLKDTDHDSALIRRSMSVKIKSLLKLTACVLVFYTLYSLWYCTDYGYTVSEWAMEKYNAFEFSRLLLFNSGKFIYDFSYAFDHIWFMLALLYVYVLVYIFARYVRRWAPYLTVLLLFLLYFGELLKTYYPIRPFGISVSTWYVLRNWLFVGVPFTMLGLWFSERYKDKGKRPGGSLLTAWVIILLGVIFTIIEYLIWGSAEVYIGSLFMVAGCLALSEAEPFGHKDILSFTGRHLSADIYYMHVFVISFFGWIVDRTDDTLYGKLWFMYLRPVAVILITVIISMLMYLVSCNKMKRKAA